MTYTQFERRIYVTIGPLAQTQGTRVGDLKISVNFTKTNDYKKNTGTIKIYNLKTETIYKLIENPPLGVTVEAGYKDNDGIIFIGTVSGMHVEYTGNDVIFTIRVIDGAVNTTNTWISKSYAKDTDPLTILKDIVIEMQGSNSKLVEGVIDASSATPYQNGFIWNGFANDALKRVCWDKDLEWFISDSTINIVRPQTPLQTTDVPYIDGYSGLIGSPQYFEEKCSLKKIKWVEKGIKFKCLLNPQIIVGNEVKIVSRFFDGNYLVKRIEIDADNRDGNFQMEVVGINEWI